MASKSEWKEDNQLENDLKTNVSQNLKRSESLDFMPRDFRPNISGVLQPSTDVFVTLVFRLRKLLKRCCNDLDVKLAFSSFKISNMFSVKDPVPVELRSNVVYKSTCASCNSCYVGETSRHLSTRIREHLNRDRTSHIFQHLQQSQACPNSCSAKCFKVIDHATTK